MLGSSPQNTLCSSYFTICWQQDSISKLNWWGRWLSARGRSWCVSDTVICLFVSWHLTPGWAWWRNIRGEGLFLPLSAIKSWINAGEFRWFCGGYYLNLRTCQVQDTGMKIQTAGCRIQDWRCKWEGRGQLNNTTNVDFFHVNRGSR